MSIKVGILLDSILVSDWQRQILAFIKNSGSFSIDLVVLNDSKKNQPKLTHGIYKAFRRLDRTLFKTSNDHFQVDDVRNLLVDAEFINVIPVQGKFSDTISDDDIILIRKKDLDIIIRFGFRVLKGAILNMARYGVWSLHHGDNRVNRGGPPGFWEVVNKEPVTGVTLQILSGELDGGKVLGQAFVKTDATSFNRNQNAVFAAGVELFYGKLQEIATRGPDIFFSDNAVNDDKMDFYSHPLYKDPHNIRSLRIFLSFLTRRLKTAFNKVFVAQQWLLIYRMNSTGIDTALYRYKKIHSPWGRDWADPFIIFNDGKYYLFFEELIYTLRKAHISCLVFDEKGKLISETPEKVLEEPHHLSYPFIFPWQGKFYMIPEGAASKSVWLYHCDSFPAQWRRYKELLKEELYDPTLYHHEGYWYLFGTKKPLPRSSPHQYLYLYYTEDLLHGEWLAHPQNPVTRDVRGARPAGRIFEHNGRIMRPSQIGAPKYGYGIRFQQIITLTPETYEERPMEDILPHWEKDLLATHTFNSDRGLTVLDIQCKIKWWQRIFRSR